MDFHEMSGVLQDTSIMRLIIRLVLIISTILLIYWYFKQRKSYQYQGIKEYKLDPLINLYIKSSIPKKKKGKKVYKTEGMCRKILENIYKCPFPSVRPSFLKSPRTGKNLELDCYNKNLGIALEYNGQQHYKYTPYFHKTKRQFYSQVHRDDWKRKKCKEHGIILIEVPYWIIKRDLREYIIKELKKNRCL